MLRHEFELLAGFAVSERDFYEVIRPMYKAVSSVVSREQFVKFFDKNAFDYCQKDTVVTQMIDVTKKIKEALDRGENTVPLFNNLTSIVKGYISAFFTDGVLYRIVIEHNVPVAVELFVPSASRSDREVEFINLASEGEARDFQKEKNLWKKFYKMYDNDQKSCNYAFANNRYASAEEVRKANFDWVSSFLNHKFTKEDILKNIPEAIEYFDTEEE